MVIDSTIIEQENVRLAQLLMRDDFFRTKPLQRFAGNSDSWHFLETVDGLHMQTASLEMIGAVRNALSDLLRVPFPTLQAQYGEIAPSVAVAMLTDIRNGQPAPLLMVKLSTEAMRAKNYLLSEFQARSRLYKMVVGDPGCGKTTFKRLLVDDLRWHKSLIGIDMNMSASAMFKPLTMVTTLLFSERMISAIFAQLALVERNDPARLEATLRQAHTFQNGHLLLCLTQLALGGGMTINDAATQIGEFLIAFRSWFVDGTKTRMRDYYEAHHINVGRLPDPPSSRIDLLQLFEEVLQFFRGIDLYPVWMIDEFESIVALNNGFQGKEGALAFMRELIDVVSAPNGFGAILFFSTRAGLSEAKKYPALADRLLGAEIFTLPNTVWRAEQFSHWDGSFAFDAIVKLYESGAMVGNEVCAGVLENLWRLDEGAKSIACEILGDNEIEPRKRLKEVVVGLIDLLSEGVRADLAIQEFVKKYSPAPDHSAVLIDQPASPAAESVVPFVRISGFSPEKFELDPEAKAILESLTVSVREPTVVTDDVAIVIDDKLPCLEEESAADSAAASDADAAISEDQAQVDAATGPRWKFEEEPTPIDHVVRFFSPRSAFSSSGEVMKEIMVSVSSQNMTAGRINTLGKRVAMWRDAHLLDDLPISVRSDIANLVSKQSPNGLIPFDDCKELLGEVFLHASDLAQRWGIPLRTVIHTLPSKKRIAKGVKSRRIVIAVNPVASLGDMRNFAYQWCFYYGCIPTDDEVDRFVLEFACKEFLHQAVPSRRGILFRQVKRGFLRSLLVSRESIEDTLFIDVVMPKTRTK